MNAILNQLPDQNKIAQNTSKRLRIGFATIGQSPRIDVVPAILEALGKPVDVMEVGALDNMSQDEIKKLAPHKGEYIFATRMADGKQVTLGKSAAEKRLAEVLNRLDDENLDLIVALCAGTSLPTLKKTLLIEPQRIVDCMTAAIAASCRRIGIVVPLAEQVALFHLDTPLTAQISVTYASPYIGDRFFKAGQELIGCQVIFMHCMGYNAQMREKVIAGSGAPTVSAPELVASVLRQLIDRP